MPLPVETPGQKAKDLIARFQQNINTTAGNDAPPLPRPRHSLAVEPGTTSTAGRRESLDVGPTLATSTRRLSYVSSSANSRTGSEDRLRSPSPAAANQPAVLTPEHASDAVKVTERSSKPERESSIEEEETKQEAKTVAEAPAQDDKAGDEAVNGSGTARSSEDPRLRQGSNGSQAMPEGSETQSASTPAKPKRLTGSTSASASKAAPKPIATTSPHPPSSSRSPLSPTSSLPPTTPSTRKTSTPSSTSQSASLRKSVSARAMTPTAASLAKSRSPGMTSPPPLPGSTASPSPSTSRLMRPTASSATKAKPPHEDSHSPSASSSRRPSTSMSNRVSSPTTSTATRGPRMARPSTSLGDSPSSSLASKALSPAAIARMEAAAQTGTGVAAPRLKSGSNARSSPSIASRDTPIKRPKTPEGRNGRADESPSVSRGLAKTPAKAASTPARTPAKTPGSSGSSRLTRPTAASAAHARAPIAASSPTTSATTPSKGKSAGTVGTRVPAGGVPPKEAGNPGGPNVKIGVVTGGAKGGVQPRLGRPAAGMNKAAKAEDGGAAKTGREPSAGDDPTQGGEEAAAQETNTEQKASDDPTEATLPITQAPDMSNVTSSVIANLEDQAAAIESNASFADDSAASPPASTTTTEPEGEVAEGANADLPAITTTTTAGGIEHIRSPLDPEKMPATPELESEEKMPLPAETAVQHPVDPSGAEGETASQAADRANQQTNGKSATDPVAVTGSEEEKVFKGFGVHRPHGKIGVVVPPPSTFDADVNPTAGPSSPAPIAPTPSPKPGGAEDFSSKWGSRDGPSPSLMSRDNSRGSGAGSPALSVGEGKKVPIWMRKGGE